MVSAAVVLVATNRALLRTRIAGPIILAFTTGARVMTVSLAGLTITHLLPSSGGCMSPGTTLINPTRTSSLPFPVITTPHGTPGHGEHSGYLHPRRADHR